MARSIPVDKDFYLTNHPDLGEAYASGALKNVAAHFVEHGFYEDRLPSRPHIDEADYVERYPDVADAIEANEGITSANEHWTQYGRFEERVVYLYVAPKRNSNLYVEE